MLDNMFSSVNLLQKGLDATWLRNEVLNNNIANVDTPGFKASDVQFEDIVASALKGVQDGNTLATTEPGHISEGADSADGPQPVIFQENDTSEAFDNNNVDIENEMSKLAKNSIEYYTMVSKINSEFKQLNNAIGVS